MKPAVLIVGHGSRDPEGTREFLGLVEMVRSRAPDRIVECGFLEFAQPVITDGIDRCLARGAATVAVQPGILLAAGHAKNDIPSEVVAARRLHPDVAFHYGRPLHLSAQVLRLCALRIEEAERAAPPRDRAETLLLVVGRGSSDPDANSDVHKLSRLLAEGMGFGWSAVAFSGVTSPLVPEALERCHRLGFRRIVVFPFFLFTGVLVKRIVAQTRAFAAEHPDVEVLSAGYINLHPLLCDAVLERADEAISGRPDMNCGLCKYRVQLPGFEDAVGQPQAGHHHHVRGIGQDHDHHHHHHQYHHHHHHEH